ncbi:MAG: alpha/beta hydrolase [Pseudomonadota bacterium]
MTAAISLNGLPTQWFDRGSIDAKLLLCLHPLGQNGTFFDGLFAALGDGWRVISFDQRGHGSAAAHPVRDFSQFVDDAEAALDRIGGKAHVAGFSLGGSIAAELASRRADDIPTLTLAATPHQGMPVFAERACAVRMGSIAAIADETVRRWFGRLDGDPAILVARASLDQLSPESFDAAWRAFATFEGYGKFAGRLPPALCLSFSQDLSTPPTIADQIADAITTAGGEAHRVDISGAGHMGLLQKPAEVASALAEFITRYHEEVTP